MNKPSSAGLPPYVSMETMAAAWSDFIAQALAGIADEAAPLVAAESDPEECRAIIQSAVASAARKLSGEAFADMLRKTLTGSMQ